MSKQYIDKNIIAVETVVLDILEHDKEYEETGNFKNTFRCLSKSGTPRLCVYWERSPNLAIGDKITMHGKIKNDVFLVKDLRITKKLDASQKGII